MINEYLFLNDEHREVVEKYKPPNGIDADVSTIKDTPLWCVAYSLTSMNEDSASKLSDVHTYIMQYSPMTLTCESSEYYNKMLFPLVNEFERKLRKLLYLSASISENQKARDTIQNLENKTLGDIFKLLFIDDEFIRRVKTRVNGTNEFKDKGHYSKSLIQSYISNIEENTLWDSLFDGDCVATIKARFSDAFDYRNDVMHAHNIQKKQYGKARYLFEKINKELDCEIGKIIVQAADKLGEIKSGEKVSISSALEAMDSYSRLAEELEKAIASSRAPLHLTQTLQDIQDYKTTQDLLSSLINNEDYKTTQGLFDSITGIPPTTISGLQRANSEVIKPVDINDAMSKSNNENQEIHHEEGKK